MIVIGFTGPAGAGKDTAATYLAEHLTHDRGLKVRVQAWANLLKVAAARSLGIEGEEQDLIDWCDWFKVDGKLMAYGPITGENSTHTITGREFLEKFGTEGGRDVYGPDHWIDLALPAPPAPLWRAGVGFPNVVIDTTTRFPNEVERIRAWGGQVWRIERPEDHLRQLTGDAAHPSRAGIPADACEAVIQNSGSIADLEDAVCEAFVVAEAAGEIKVPV